ncbi:MAG TPA: DUF6266 family protein [Prolixibacteraceae bacterium]|jgi:hypothetical protein
MAILKGGVDGPISGLVGTVICYKVDGVNYMRGKIGPRSKNSWSEKQVLHRTRISSVGSMWKSLANNPVRLSWKAAAGTWPGYSLFLKTNLAAFSADGSQVDLEYLHLSTGNLPLPHQLNASVSGGNDQVWEATWLNDAGKGLAKSKDELLVMVVRDGNFSHLFSTGAKRDDQSASFELPVGEGTVQGIYLSFASGDKSSYSLDQFFVAG